MSLLNFHDFQKFWGFCITSVVSLGLSEILSELKKLNKNLESTTPKEKLL
jgi:hypothetical protein